MVTVCELGSASASESIATVLENDVECANGVSVKARSLSLVGLGRGLTRLVFSGQKGMRFTGNELILRDMDIVLTATTDQPALAIIPAKAGPSPLRVRLERVQIIAKTLGLWIVAPTAGLDLFMEDVWITVGQGVGLVVGRHTTPPVGSRCSLRACRFVGSRPAILAVSGARIRDCRFTNVLDAQQTAWPGIQLVEAADCARVTRCTFDGTALAAVTVGWLPNESSGGAPPSDLQIVQSDARSGVNSLLKLSASGDAAGPQGLWLDTCTRFADSKSAGAFVDETTALGAPPPVARLWGCFNRDSLGRYFTHGGAGFDVAGHHAELCSGRSDDSRRKGGNLLRDTGFLAVSTGTTSWYVDAPAAPHLGNVLSGSMMDGVLGRIDAFAVGGFLGKYSFRQLAHIQGIAGQSMVFSLFARRQVPDGLMVTSNVSSDVDLRIWVESPQGVVGGSNTIRFRVRDAWHRFSAVVATVADSSFVVCVDAVSVPGSAGTTATVMLWAPQLELGMTPTDYQPRDVNVDPNHTLDPWPRPLQAMMLGPMTISYADGVGQVPAEAQVGDRFLNMAPAVPTGATESHEGWVLVAGAAGAASVHPFNPIDTGPIATCAPFVAAAATKIAAAAAPPKRFASLDAYVEARLAAM